MPHVMMTGPQLRACMHVNNGKALCCTVPANHKALEGFRSRCARPTRAPIRRQLQRRCSSSGSGGGTHDGVDSYHWLLDDNKSSPSKAARQQYADLLTAARWLREGYNLNSSVDRSPNLRKNLHHFEPSLTSRAEALEAAARAPKQVVSRDAFPCCYLQRAIPLRLIVDFNYRQFSCLSTQICHWP